MSILINKDNFEELVLKSEKPVLLDFWATWCGPCKMISPTLEEIAEENEDIVVGKINVDEQPELATAFRIQSIPALFVVSGGKIVNQTVGFQSKNSILKLLEF